MKKRNIGITMGDPAGIGAEIIIKAIVNDKIDKQINPIIIGDVSAIKHYLKLLNIDNIEVNEISSVDDYHEGGISVIQVGELSDQWVAGNLSKECGDAAFQYIVKSIELAKSGDIDAVVTTPINKEALKLAGHNYPGHTEIYGEYTDTKNFTMMFKLDKVSVVHVTTHCSLLESIEKINKRLVLDNILLLRDSLSSLGIENPRIAVSGLNPHAGEGGMFGNEEINHITPAVKEATAMGIDISGPFPPDTVFMRAFKGEFDGVVSMLHDHGFVALKSLDFDKGVNITIGLPIIRTSVGHGTAFDIAGKNIASTASLLSAIAAADSMAKNR